MHLPGTSSLPRYTLSQVSKALSIGLFGTMVGLSATSAQASGAQTSAPIPVNSQGPGTTAAQSGPVVLSGGVVDPDGAEIPGALSGRFLMIRASGLAQAALYEAAAPV